MSCTGATLEAVTNRKGAIVTINDRLTGFSWSAQLEDKGADNVADAIIQMLMPFKGYLHTLTFDNGRESAHHEGVSEALGISIFFAKPYHSWERGANENTNGLYQQYIPKGTDFQALDKDVLPTARLMLNTRPRKRLNFISPIQEIFRIFASDFKYCKQSCICNLNSAINRLEDYIESLFKKSFDFKITLLILLDNVSAILVPFLRMRKYYSPVLGHPINGTLYSF